MTFFDFELTVGLRCHTSQGDLVAYLQGIASFPFIPVKGMDVICDWFDTTINRVAWDLTSVSGKMDLDDAIFEDEDAWREEIHRGLRCGFLLCMVQNALTMKSLPEEFRLIPGAVRNENKNWTAL